MACHGFRFRLKLQHELYKTTAHLLLFDYLTSENTSHESQALPKQSFSWSGWASSVCSSARSWSSCSSWRTSGCWRVRRPERSETRRRAGCRAGINNTPELKARTEPARRLDKTKVPGVNTPLITHGDVYTRDKARFLGISSKQDHGFRVSLFKI